MNTDAFLNGIASFQGGFNEDDANFARGKDRYLGRRFFNTNERRGKMEESVGNIRTNLYTLHNQHRDAMMMKDEQRTRETSSAIFGRKALRGASSNQDGNFGLSRPTKTVAEIR